jgi:hypothetical protein
MHRLSYFSIQLGGAYRDGKARWQVRAQCKHAVLSARSNDHWRSGPAPAAQHPTLGHLVFSPPTNRATGQIFSRHGRAYPFDASTSSMDAAMEAMVQAIGKAEFNPVWVRGYDNAFSQCCPVDDMAPGQNANIYLLEWLDRLGMAINELQSVLNHPTPRETRAFTSLKDWAVRAQAASTHTRIGPQKAVDRFNHLALVAAGLVDAVESDTVPDLPFDSQEFWNVLLVRGRLCAT